VVLYIWQQSECTTQFARAQTASVKHVGQFLEPSARMVQSHAVSESSAVLLGLLPCPSTCITALAAPPHVVVSHHHQGRDQARGVSTGGWVRPTDVRMGYDV
jgi:hypothetical protein